MANFVDASTGKAVSKNEVNAVFAGKSKVVLEQVDEGQFNEYEWRTCPSKVCVTEEEVSRMAKAFAGLRQGMKI